jgi:DNA-binding NtrC family response regulator
MGKKFKILVIDDDEGVRETLQSILETEEYEVEAVECGKEAIAKANASFYNLALIDIGLPDMEGTRLLSELRSTTPKMVKIIITGNPSTENAIAAVNRGADAFIVKPFNATHVLKLVGDHLKKQGEAEKYSEERVAEFVETRARKLGRRLLNVLPRGSRMQNRFLSCE